eukprot:CAMPEP_0172313228 /NCGR_PEP_ID=MMETSP1058-20130122/19738_1 /TAXON_ID=83371 /ORGANISM="Detonula confervacea, Strain CCMP 353" /LENGTH=476 /DNA_ID=CAMNT_0013026845 /DNA_START=128 /DNA_END=1558 /DNA_ORIENTATION=-
MSQLLRILLIATLLPSLLHAQTGGNLSNCKGGCELGELCIGNPFSQPVSDSECNTCAGGRYWWPCNFETLCYCNSVEEGAPRVPPAPKSRVKFNDSLDPCKDILTEDIFNAIVQPTSEEGKNLYTYDGLCNAIILYNTYHDEKFANMGTEEQMRAEMAAFLAHAAVDTHGFSIVREDFHCVDPIVGSDGKTYCKPCKEEHYNSQTKTCSQGYFASEESYKEYCDSTRQDTQGCVCNTESVLPANNVPLQVSAGNIDTSGYMAASDAYFTRGAIQISWNYDYLGASLSMTGDENFLCNNPDLVATNPQMAWGVGIYKWMEKMTFGTTGSTAHKQALKGNFGGTIEVLYGSLECPSNQWSSSIHVNMVQDRVAQVCKSGAALGVYLEMDKCDTPRDCLECKGLKEIYESCQENGSCPDCSAWPQFVRSTSPTVTPVRVQSPSWDDWAGTYGSTRSSADVGLRFWHLVLFSAGSLFVAI